MDAQPARQPNILLIHADQHRFDCLGAYGNPDIRTPNIDALAQQGVTHLNHFCPYPVCTPSRYSLLSGLYVHEHQGSSNHSTLHPDIPTVPRILRSAGYRTAAVGKMHFTPTYLDVGFDRMVLCEQDGDGRWDDDYHRYLRDLGLCDLNDIEDQRKEYRKDAPVEYWQQAGALVSNLPDEHTSTTWIADRAVEEIETWDGGGNCLMVGFVKPHHPLDPPREWADAYDPEAIELLPGWAEQVPNIDETNHRGYYLNDTISEMTARRSTAFYYALISQIDHHVGRMVDALKRRGVEQDTLVIYTSDHGDYMGYHHMVGKNNYMYDPLMKVPLIIRYPQGFEAAVTRPDSLTEALSSNIDLAPTILGVAGCVGAADMHGRDLAWDTEGREAVFAEGRVGGEHGQALQMMVRTPESKLLWSPLPGKTHFFDLGDDPLEMSDLAGDPDRTEEIEALYEMGLAWRGSDRVEPPFVNENAPVISGPNVPPPEGGHRAEMEKYYAETVASLRNR